MEGGVRSVGVVGRARDMLVNTRIDMHWCDRPYHHHNHLSRSLPSHSRAPDAPQSGAARATRVRCAWQDKTRVRPRWAEAWEAERGCVRLDGLSAERVSADPAFVESCRVRDTIVLGCCLFTPRWSWVARSAVWLWNRNGLPTYPELSFTTTCDSPGRHARDADASPSSLRTLF